MDCRVAGSAPLSDVVVGPRVALAQVLLRVSTAFRSHGVAAQSEGGPGDPMPLLVTAEPAPVDEEDGDIEHVGDVGMLCIDEDGVEREVR